MTTPDLALGKFPGGTPATELSIVRKLMGIVPSDTLRGIVASLLRDHGRAMELLELIEAIGFVSETPYDLEALRQASRAEDRAKSSVVVSLPGGENKLQMRVVSRYSEGVYAAEVVGFGDERVDIVLEAAGSDFEFQVVRLQQHRTGMIQVMPRGSMFGAAPSSARAKRAVDTITTDVL